MAMGLGVRHGMHVTQVRLLTVDRSDEPDLSGVDVRLRGEPLPEEHRGWLSVELHPRHLQLTVTGVDRVAQRLELPID